MYGWRLVDHVQVPADHGKDFSFECGGSPQRVCTEEGCDQVCVVKRSIVAERRRNFREAEME